MTIAALALAAPVAAGAQGTSYDDCRKGTAPPVTLGPEPLQQAVCIPAGEHSTYAGGDEQPCGVIVVGGLTVIGDPRRDPATQCWGEPPKGAGVTGRLFQPAIRSKRGVVAARSPLAAQAGIEVLDKGGNAIDAAAAATFAGGVVRPEMCGIGGGGFLVYRKADGEVATLDFSARTPAATTPERYKPLGRDEFAAGYRIAGVPGTVAGMDAAVKRFGRLTLADAIAPAARLAREGFEVSTALALSYAAWTGLTWELHGNGFVSQWSPYANSVRLRLDPEAARWYLTHGVVPPKAGSKLVLTDYARTLETIADQGADAFYRGEIADKIVAAMEASRESPLEGDRGIMTREDLARYEPKWQTPLTGTYRDAQIVTVGPSSAGGPFLIEALNILEGFDLNGMGHSSASHLHVLAETQKLAWADAVEHVDPEDEYPIATLASKDWAAQRRALIEEAWPEARQWGAGEIPADENTLHLSVLDAKGNAAAVTCSVGVLFGAAVVPDGTGFLLSTETPTGKNKDTLEGNRRFRSSKTPVIVVRDGIPILATGGAGGPTIPMGVLGAVSNAVDFDMDPAEAIDAARVNAVALGGPLAIEGARVPPEELDRLRTHHKHNISDRADLGRGPRAEYGFGPIMAAVGVDPVTGERLASDDPREERGPAAQGPKKAR